MKVRTTSKVGESHRRPVGPSLVREVNRGRVLSVLRRSGPLSRVEVCRKARLSQATMSRIIDELVGARLVVEDGFAESSGGRKPTLLRFNSSGGYIIGVELLPPEITAAVIDLSGKIKHRTTRAIKASDAKEVILDSLCDAVEELLTQLPHNKQNVVGLGIGCSGEIDHKRGVVILSTNFGWRNVPLKAMVEERCDIRTFIDTVPGIEALGECCFGVARNVENLVYVCAGYGLGAALVMGGNLYRGRHSRAGEIGHSLVIEGGPQCTCGKRGCMESFVSQRAIVSFVQDGLDQGKDSSIHEMLQARGTTLDVRLIFGAARGGDGLAMEALRRTGHYLGLGIANIINTLDPDMIVLGGYIVEEGGEPLFELAKETGYEKSLDCDFREVRIEPAALGKDSGVIGAAALVHQDIFRSPILVQ